MTAVAGAVTSATGSFSLEVAEGQYFVYAVDPSGSRRAGFAGAPDLFDVRAGESTSASAELEPALGAIQGAVTDATSGEPVDGAWVIALGSSGAAERAVPVAADGRYRIDGLRAGAHRLAFLDGSAQHATEYFDGSSTIMGAHVVTVGAGVVLDADGALTAQTAAPGASVLRGAISDEASGSPVPGALVLALRASDLALARAVASGEDGHYELLVPEGSYRLAFVDPTGGHEMQWHAAQPYYAVGAGTTVEAPAVVDAALPPTTGQLEGTVLSELSQLPVPGAWVFAIDANGGLRGAATDASGGFEVTGLRPGTYRVAVLDPTGAHSVEYWDGHLDYGSADPFTIEVGVATSVQVSLTPSETDTLLDDAIGWWDASSGLLPNGSLPDLSRGGHDLAMLEGLDPVWNVSYPPALVAPDPARGRHLFSPGWDDMYLDTPDPTDPIVGIDVAWDGDLDRVLDVAAWKDINWLVHQGTSEDGTFSWAVGVVAATGQVEVRWSEDGSTVSSLRTTAAFPSGAQRGAVTLDPVTGDLVVYRQGPDAAPASFDLAYDGPEWVEVERVAGTGPVVLHDSTDPVRHSSAVPRDRIGDSTGEGWFEALYALRVRTAPGGPTAAAFDVGLVPDEPEWELETGLPPLFPGNEDGEASSTRFPGGAGETWTIHNYTTSSYPILLVDRPSVLFGNRSYASAGIDDDVFGIEPGEDLSVWIAYSYPRVGTGGGPYVAVKDWSPDATAPGWALLSSPFFAGPSAVVSDGTAVVHDPAPAVTDSRLNLSGFQIDGTAGTVQSFSNGVATEAPVSIAGLGPLAAPGTPLTVAGYGDTGTQGPSFAFAALVVFDRTLTPEEIERLPAELGLVPE
ncbi:MAG: carboxypeptidase regulatory-like domain-containing protein [Acidimicrobiales bacterium]|nr:carboxypeptidase regulatory-like domain-containing protein [Acidimicrobiales bacterium]